MKDIDLAWLAGWLEGEGCFLYYEQTSYSSARLTIESFSTDQDVVERAARITGASVYGRQPRPEPEWSRKFGWRLHLGSEKAADLMREILPHMGERRATQIRKALDAWDGRLSKPRMVKCACGCGREFLRTNIRNLYARGSTGACAAIASRRRRKVSTSSTQTPGAASVVYHAVRF